MAVEEIARLVVEVARFAQECRSVFVELPKQRGYSKDQPSVKGAYGEDGVRAMTDYTAKPSTKTLSGLLLLVTRKGVVNMGCVTG